MKSLLFLTSGLGDNLLALPLALELEEKTALTFVVPKGPQHEFFSRGLPNAQSISYDKSYSADFTVLRHGWSADVWVYPVGSCTRKLRLLHLAAQHKRAVAFTSLNSEKSWQAEIGIDLCLTPNMAQSAWKNNLRLATALGIHAPRTWDDYVQILSKRLPRQAAAGNELLIHPGSAHYAGGIEKYKRWPLERFLEVAERLLHDGQFEKAGWFLGPDDAELEAPCSALLKKSKFSDRMRIVSHREFGSSLLKLGEFLSSRAYLLTNDSGIAHLASLYAVPMTSLTSGLGEPAYTGQNGVRTQLIVERTPCYGCAVGISATEAKKFECRHDWACMDRISVDQVTNAVRKHVLSAPVFS